MTFKELPSIDFQFLLQGLPGAGSVDHELKGHLRLLQVPLDGDETKYDRVALLHKWFPHLMNCIVCTHL